MKFLKIYVMVGIGGVVGAISRYGISIGYQAIDPWKAFPFPVATWMTNLIGCFLLSYLLSHRRLQEKIPSNYFTALTTGVLGAFTTFSTVTVETLDLWLNNPLLAIIYIICSVLGGLVSCYGGLKLATRGA